MRLWYSRPVRLWLSFPPSMNSLKAYGRGKSYPTTTYRKWWTKAGEQLAKQRLPRTITGPVAVRYRFSELCRKARVYDGRAQLPDVFNYEKALSDMLTHAKVWADDSQIMRGQVEWARIDRPIVLIEIIPLPFWHRLSRLFAKGAADCKLLVQ